MLTAQAAPQATAEYEAQFDLLMQEAENINSRMQQERGEIERPKTEEKTVVKEIGRLKDVTRTLLVSRGAEF